MTHATDTHFDIGRAIRTTRKERGLSQRDLAERAGVSHGAVGHYEAGRNDPNVQTLVRIARALGVGVGFLVQRAEGQQ